MPDMQEPSSEHQVDIAALAVMNHSSNTAATVSDPGPPLGAVPSMPMDAAQVSPSLVQNPSRHDAFPNLEQSLCELQRGRVSALESLDEQPPVRACAINAVPATIAARTTRTCSLVGRRSKRHAACGRILMWPPTTTV